MRGWSNHRSVVTYHHLKERFKLICFIYIIFTLCHKIGKIKPVRNNHFWNVFTGSVKTEVHPMTQQLVEPPQAGMDVELY